MAAALVGGAVLSSFLNVFFERLVHKDVLQLLKGDKLIETLLRQLNTKLLSATALLNDAEEKQLGDTNVRNWLDQLKQVVYEADRVTDKINTQARRLKLKKDELKSTTIKKYFSFNFNNPFKVSVVKSEIEEILNSLKDLLEQSDHLGLKEVDQKFTTLHTPHAPLLDDSQVYGREGDKEAILKLLLCDDDATSPNISVVPIVGMGGIGKTTLAQSVYDNTEVEKHFALKVWVTISDDFDVRKISNSIFYKITGKNNETGELHQLLKDLKDALAGKKFFFVFDDVWNEKYDLWYLLKSSFQSGAKGSKVIVTTRNEDIALKMKTGNVQTYELKTMSDDGCWQLFEEHAFDNVDRNERVLLGQLQEIGRKIVNKCKGVPLAIKSMAGLLRSMRTCEDWRHVLQSDVWKRHDCRDIGIVPALWLSYRFLPPYLKPCLSYLSIFPKDYEFRDVDRKKLILIWMAEGLLQPQEGRTIEDVGEDYLNALIARSFFQRNTRNDSFVMHDLIHDLAVYVSGQSFLSYDSYKKDLHKLSSKTHHLSYGYFFNTKEIDFTKVKNLRSLISLPLRSIPSSSLETVVQEVVLRNGGLRVLSFVGEHIDLITNLKHLRYLDASDNDVKELPASICGLHNLETLLLSKCYKLTQLPDSIGNLKHLRYLDASGSKVKELPASICELHNLETLLLSGCRMLTQLPDSIGNLKYLRYLDVSYTKVKELPDSVCLLYNLETLLLEYCQQLTLLPTKICELINLRHLKIKWSSLKEMPPRISNMKNLQELSDFVLCENDGYRIKELGKLDNLQLHGRLRISGLQHVREVSDVLEVLKNKEYLTELTLEWDGKTNDSIRDREILTALQPHPNLKSLEIVGYEGMKLPEWVVDPVYSNLEVVSLQGQNCCLSLLSFQHLSSLKELDIDLMAIDITNEFCNNCSHNSFPVLEEMRLRRITALDWSSINTNYQNGDIFPCLKIFILHSCSSLNVALPMGNFPSLDMIEIGDCDELVTVFPSTSTDIDVAYPSLRSLLILNCSRLESVSEMGLLPASLERLHIDSCNTVIGSRMQWNLQRFSKLTELTLFNYGGVVDSFPEEGLLPSSLTFLCIKNFDKLTALNTNGFHHLTSLQELSLWKLEKLECLPIGLPQTLTTLCIVDSPLLIPRCKRETGEDWPNIQHIRYIIIDDQLLK
ncbi:putative disease resistance protein At3g14460 [Cannabis sativa]|uniref:putative disease resistance protein At3g14460 n=1 Tax=Cannabis sativa TaxID=3483 RepID=UPI0029C9CD70|nr:putative disease resistance protein At3g14460 [Cannabis sativa]